MMADQDIAPPKRPRGRPPGSRLPPELRTEARSIRLNNARWAKLQQLGRAWLEKVIDKARVE